MCHRSESRISTATSIMENSHSSLLVWFVCFIITYLQLVDSDNSLHLVSLIKAKMNNFDYEFRKYSKFGT